MACLDEFGSRLLVTSVLSDNLADLPNAFDQCPGDLISIDPVAPDAVDLSALMKAASEPHCSPSDESLPGASWKVFRCTFSSGIRDQVALLSAETDDAVAAFLRKFWLGVRRMCLQEAADAPTTLSDDAMLWMISRKVNASILVLDRQCRVLRSNAAAREMLAHGDLLRNSPHGLCTTRDQETRALRTAVTKIFSEPDPKNTEYVLFLRRSKKTQRIPMTLSLYQPPTGGAGLILAMLPMPPEQKRIEGLVRQMGLTPSEARVAALIRSGLSNRKAAEIAGLKVETFNTYAKRVLSKMNVSCRAEMAQMLTWQASMERSL